MKHLFRRTSELNELISFCENKKPGFLYLRGRRRVGKSWLLQSLSKKSHDIFYFSGELDSSAKEAKLSFISAWTKFSSSYALLQLNSKLLTWERIFAEILTEQQKSKKRVTLVLDEIQWLAKTGSGFIGALKNAWVQFETHNAFNIIICGSSNKFFSDHVGGEEKILRGLATRSPIWVEPISPKRMAKEVFLNWNLSEITFLYMMTGGVPYYLERIDPDMGFINAINEAFFLDSSIFLNEADEILNIEFNKTGCYNTHEILSEIGINKKSQSKIRESLKISSSTLSELIEKLVSYQILFIETNQKKIKGREVSYFMKDFFLNFYFSIYQDHLPAIKKNKSSLIFNHLVSKNGYYVENFTGRAFENFVRYCIEKAPLSSSLYKKLKIFDYHFDLYSYKSIDSQIDLVINHKNDRLLRVIECKWGKEDAQFIDEVMQKIINLGPIQSRMNILAISFKPTASFLKKCKNNKIVLITLEDLFY